MRTFMRALILAGMATMVIVGTAVAQQTDPIDAGLQGCLAAPDGSTTAGMLTCYDQATTLWDKRLTVAYGQLMKTLDPASRASLLTAERAWVDFRQKNDAFNGAPWRERTGSLSRVIFASANMERVKQRALDLEFVLTGD
jgi:uncharacterized protein YecT (DUF1311 family)